MIWIYYGVQFLLLMIAFKFLLDVFLVIWGNIFYGVPYVPTRVGLIIELMKRLKLKEGVRIVELGSGDGRVSVLFARNFKVNVVGLEKMWWLRFVSGIRARLVSKKGKVSFFNRDLFMEDLKGYDVVYMYLLPVMIGRLAPKLERMKKGSLVISFDYPLKSGKFKLNFEIGDRQKLRVYEKT